MMKTISNEDAEDRSTGGKGRSSAVMTHPTCKVCNSDQRREIEFELLVGGSRQAIAERFSTEDSAFNRQNLCTHYNRHMSVVDEAAFAAAEAERNRRALDVPTATVALGRHKQLVADLLEEGMEAVMSGEVRWSLRDVLQLSAELDRLERAAEQVALAAVMDEARVFSETVKAVVPRDQWQAIVDGFDRGMAESPRFQIVTDVGDEEA